MKRKCTRIIQRFSLLLVVAIATVLCAACGGSSEAEPAPNSTVQPSHNTTTQGGTPPPLSPGGQMGVCIDVPYPPAEYLDGPSFVGYEIEIMNDIAKRLGVTANYISTPFDTIIDALRGKKCDAIISSMTITPERQQLINMIEYLEIGQSALVVRGAGVSVNAIDDLAGKTAGVLAGSAVQDTLENKNLELLRSGQGKIKIKPFSDLDSAADELSTGRIDAVVGAAPAIADVTIRRPEQYSMSSQQMDPAPVGIGVQKENQDLSDAITNAVQAMYKDGTMKNILTKWHVPMFALSVVRDAAGNVYTNGPKDDKQPQGVQGQQGVQGTQGQVQEPARQPLRGQQLLPPQG